MPLPRSTACPCSSNAQLRRQTDRQTRDSGRPTACASQRAWDHLKATQYGAVLEQPASFVQVRLCGPSFAILRVGLQAPAVAQLAGVIAPAASCRAAFARAQCPGFICRVLASRTPELPRSALPVFDMLSSLDVGQGQAPSSRRVGHKASPGSSCRVTRQMADGGGASPRLRSCATLHGPWTWIRSWRTPRRAASSRKMGRTCRCECYASGGKINVPVAACRRPMGCSVDLCHMDARIASGSWHLPVW